LKETPQMQIAYTMAPGRGDTDLLLSGLAETLAERGHATCGSVQINTERGGGPCDMDVSVLPNGPILRISQDLGTAARGCRLDPTALETAVGLVETRLKAGADLLIINKFGKHEADGRGFRTVIAEAIGLGIPVLVGVNALNLEAFQSFVGPDAVRLKPSEEAILAWFEAALTAEHQEAC
jgi:nucleoside-triphosphatase THEP1